MKTKLSVFALAGFLFSAWAVSIFADEKSAAPSTGWQHLALQREASRPLAEPEFSKQINDLGRKGWELVDVLNFSKEGTTTKTVYYFKKPL